MTYTELLQKIRDYTEVDANVFTSTIIDLLKMLNLEFLEISILIITEDMIQLI